MATLHNAPRARFGRLWMLAIGASIHMSAHADGPKGIVYQITTPKPASMYAAPAFYAWAPEGEGPFRSVIVHQHGCTREGDAQHMMDDVQWKTLAKKWHSVFVAPRFITGAPGTGSSDCGNWNDIKNGSGDAFLAALDTLARRTGHGEIKSIPWALWGHSGGSMWSTAMAGKYPERVAAVVAQSCGTEISGVDAALKIPILHHNGKSDLCYNDGYFAKGRARGALWAHAVNPFVTWAYNPSNNPPTMMGHAPMELRMIAISWLDIGLSERLPAPGQSALRDMDTSIAWLGDTATKAIAPASGYAGDKLKACWFPNQYAAQKWQEYMATGRIKDSLLPPAPGNLSGSYANRQIRLNWDSDADLETGIKTFIVYRDGRILDSLRYPNMPQTHFTLEKGYQRWNDGDQPVPSPAPAMTFTDAGVTDTGTYVYQIACVNWAGLAGAKSASLTLKRGQVTAVARISPSRSAAGRKRVFHGWDPRRWIGGPADGIDEVYDARGSLIFKAAAGTP
jgi:pimeloyl-ACP methyl ester carboxylesterase